ncbi:hypothetical protein NHP190033_04860 [Helicobacter suis]|nr:hypothetical protein NHP190033_04860 [Helicobacter suis]
MMLEAFRAYIQTISQEDGKHQFSLDSVLEMGQGLKAIELLREALNAQKQIIIGGDYDCDGMSGTALVLYFFKEVLHYPHINYIIPQRNTDCYGMSVELLEEYENKRRLVRTHYKNGQPIGGIALNLHNSLFITIDNGATIPDSVCDFLHARNTRLILSDHHHFLEDRIPKCDAFIHPLLNDNHPFKGISGACVGYLFMLAYAKQHKIKMRLDHLQYMQVLAGISTIGDMMDVSAPYNRQLLKRMDKTLKTNMPASLQAIYQAQKYKNPYKLSTLAWDVIPLINAVGRFDGISGFCHCNLVVDLLATQQANPAYAALLVEANEKRKICVQSLKKSLETTQKNKLIYTGGEVPRGVLGVLANQLLENEGVCIALCWRYQGESVEVSLRAKEGDLIVLFTRFKEMGIEVLGGGHKQACGMVFNNDADCNRALEYLGGLDAL